MIKNFKLDQNNALLFDGITIDLHNNMEFRSIIITGKNRLFEIEFDPHPVYGAEENPISLLFTGIKYLELSPKFESVTITDLEEMGYKNPADKDDNWLLDESQSSSTDHLFFRMNDEHFIRVYSEKARVKYR